MIINWIRHFIFYNIHFHICVTRLKFQISLLFMHVILINVIVILTIFLEPHTFNCEYDYEKLALLSFSFIFSHFMPIIQKSNLCLSWVFSRYFCLFFLFWLGYKTLNTVLTEYEKHYDWIFPKNTFAPSQKTYHERLCDKGIKYTEWMMKNTSSFRNTNIFSMINFWKFLNDSPLAEFRSREKKKHSYKIVVKDNKQIIKSDIKAYGLVKGIQPCNKVKNFQMTGSFINQSLRMIGPHPGGIICSTLLLWVNLVIFSI